jgi:cytochrome c oxidase cbb3-type subunit III
MYSRSRSESILGIAALTAAIAMLVTGCAREKREFVTPAPAAGPPSVTAISPLVGGQTDFAYRAQQQRFYGENAYQLSQGKTLYGAFNCYGCHAWGGGDIGPPLMDDKWIYGGEIDQVYLSIAQGRPNGMPAFAGKITSGQIWQISAYVRSMAGQAPKAAAPGRDDHLRTPRPQEAPPQPIGADERED